jgi:5-oxoprolinase (ATP-hydrolysing) subunit B
MAHTSARYLPAGDTALIVELGQEVDPETNARVLALDSALAAAAIEGIVEAVPTYRSLLIHYDPARIGYEDLVARVARLEPTRGVVPAGRLWTIPVAYGGPFGEDLEAVAAAPNLAPDAVVGPPPAGSDRV